MNNSLVVCQTGVTRVGGWVAISLDDQRHESTVTSENQHRPVTQNYLLRAVMIIEHYYSVCAPSATRQWIVIRIPISPPHRRPTDGRVRACERMGKYGHTFAAPSSPWHRYGRARHRSAVANTAGGRQTACMLHYFHSSRRSVCGARLIRSSSSIFGHSRPKRPATRWRALVNAI